LHAHRCNGDAFRYLYPLLTLEDVESAFLLSASFEERSVSFIGNTGAFTPQ